MFYLSLLVWTPVIAATLILLPIFNNKAKQLLAAASCVISLGIALQLAMNFDMQSPLLQLQETLNWIPFLHAKYSLAVDGISFNYFNSNNAYYNYCNST